MTDRRYPTGSPTREEVLAEIGRVLQEWRNVPTPNQLRIDRLQAAYDVVMLRWTNGAPAPYMDDGPRAA